MPTVSVARGVPQGKANRNSLVMENSTSVWVVLEREENMEVHTEDLIRIVGVFTTKELAFQVVFPAGFIRHAWQLTL